MVRLTDSPAMILVVYSGRKEIKLQQHIQRASYDICERYAYELPKGSTNVGYFRCSGNAQNAS